MKRVFGAMLLCISTLAQAPVATDDEKRELAAAVQEANTSGFDIIRALEAHLRKYPNTALRPEIFNLLSKAAVEAGNNARIIRYGEPALTALPNDVGLLDQVSRALLDTGPAPVLLLLVLPALYILVHRHSQARALSRRIVAHEECAPFVGGD